ncbi:pesticin C-terminus-like muramidase, partial [Aliivibrio salmonicida]|uniref:pesticin C-terminus-like muramidase n=1 Tax=Aliivibrio salmonicida TaxID=40269 RepID=UPI003D0CDFA0
LYMHLAPPSDIGANASVTTRYKLLTGRNVRTFKLDSEPERNKHESTISLPADSVFEYLYAEEKTTKPYTINSKTYNTIKCRVISVGNNANTKQKSLQGKTVWFASGLNSPFDILENPKVVSKEPMSEPKWMSHSLAQIRDGSVQVISTTNTNNTPIPPEAMISIEAGDDIGYMGLHEYSQDTHATKKEDNRVHIEVFSVKQPPEFFLKSLGPKNAESNGFTLIDGSSSSGALDDSNLLFKEIAEQITQATQDGTKIDFSSYTPKELKVYLNTKQEKFEKLIVKHASEWHDKSNSHMFNSIVEAGRKILEDKLITRFISRDEYDSSDYKKLVLEAHDKLVDHEKERIDKFAWMQDASELNIPKEIWHFWPFTFKSTNCPIHPTCVVKHYYSVTDKKYGEIKISQFTFDDILSREQYMPKPYVPDNSETSGITIGYGYDLGHQTKDIASNELGTILNASDVLILLKVIGKKGKSARLLLNDVSSINLSKEEAKKLAWLMKKRYAIDMVKAYPDVIQLNPHCQGALLGLIINRGTSFGTVGRSSWETRKEMRDISKHLEENQFTLIANDIRNMKRLWENKGLGDLIKRREFEALMFEKYGECTCYQN